MRLGSCSTDAVGPIAIHRRCPVLAVSQGQEETAFDSNVHELEHAGLVDLVMRLIARQPQDRYSHARDVLDDLATHGEPVKLREKLG